MAEPCTSPVKSLDLSPGVACPLVNSIQLVCSLLKKVLLSDAKSSRTHQLSVLPPKQWLLFCKSLLMQAGHGHFLQQKSCTKEKCKHSSQHSPRQEPGRTSLDLLTLQVAELPAQEQEVKLDLSLYLVFIEHFALDGSPTLAQSRFQQPCKSGQCYHACKTDLRVDGGTLRPGESWLAQDYL